MSQRQEKKLRKLARKAANAMTFEANSILEAIKETWTEDEINALRDWLTDKEAGPWV